MLTECNVPKGSFYHFFPSKEDFALAVLESQISRIEYFGKKYLQQPGKPYIERFVDFYFNLMKPIQSSDYTIGCLVGTFGQEMSALSSPLRSAVGQGLNVLKGLICGFIKDGQQHGELDISLNAESLANYIVSAMQGSIILAKVEKSNQPIEIFINTSAGMLKPANSK